MSLADFDSWCHVCLESVDDCDEDICCECGERHAVVWEKSGEGFCLRCRSGCESCGEAVLPGAHICAVCAFDLSQTNLFTPGLASKGVA